VNLPSGITAGQLLVLLIRAAGNNGVLASVPSGWSALVQDEGSDASNDPTHILYRWADGTEGSTLSVDFSGSIKGAAIAYRITGAINPATQPPQVSTVAVGTGTNPDPTGVTPTGGSKDYLFIAFGGLDGETQTFSAAPSTPSSYSNLQQANSGTGGAASTNVRIAGASRQATVSSEDPGAFTAEAPETGWTAFVIAIHPAAAGAITRSQAVIVA
jgi:hypothetical protein